MSTSATTNVSQDISQRTQSLMQQSIQPLSSPLLVHSSLPPITVTFTDVVYTTIDSTDSLIPVTVSDTPSQQIPTDGVTPVVNHSNNIDPWTHRLHQLLPFLGVFAVIGLLAVLLMLCFLGYRFVSAGGGGRRRQRHRRHRRSVDYDNIDINNHEQLQEKSNRGACWTRTKSQQPSPQQSSPIIFQEPIPARLRQYFRNDSSVSDENYNQPISNTFVPLETSPMTLVDRRDILQDPIRKRGVDELAMWEKKQKQRQLYSMQDYPESPDVLQPSSASSSETVQPLALSPITNTVHSPLPTSEKSPPLLSHVALARYALQKSHLHNSSSQWLQPSGSSKSF